MRSDGHRAGVIRVDYLLATRRPLTEIDDALEDLTTGSVLRTVIRFGDSWWASPRAGSDGAYLLVLTPSCGIGTSPLLPMDQDIRWTPTGKPNLLAELALLESLDDVDGGVQDVSSADYD